MILLQIVAVILVAVLVCTPFITAVILISHRHKTENNTNDEQLDQWAHSTPVINVLTSPQMGAWLERRDKRIVNQNTGKWIISKLHNEYDEPFVKCSKCWHSNDVNATPYCPYCGAKMRVEG